MKNWKKIALGFVLVLLLAQLIPIDRSTPTVAPADDLIVAMQPPPPIADMLKNACYDCHSYESKYPWYSKVAPVSWWIQNHINEGREHLNFSTWGTNMDKGEALEECAEEVSEGEMPLRSYTWGHPEARLTKTERQQLANWFQQNGGGGETGHGNQESGGEDDDD